MTTTARPSVILKSVAPGPLAAALCLAAPVVAAALLFVWIRVTTIRLGYALSQATADHGRLLAERDSLRLEVAALKTPQRLAKLASERGMAAPPPERVLPLRAQ